MRAQLNTTFSHYDSGPLADQWNEIGTGILEQAALMKMLGLIFGFSITGSIAVAAELGIAGARDEEAVRKGSRLENWQRQAGFATTHTRMMKPVWR